MSKHQPPDMHLRVLDAIANCRTAALGGHADQCDSCGHIRISYNSCRNRHCPKCQGIQREKWIQARQQQLLPVRYFHVVFTLPQELNVYCLHHPTALYNLCLHPVKQPSKHLLPTLNISALYRHDQRTAYLGTNLMLHPHVHMIVPAGGFTTCGHWKHTKQKEVSCFL